MTWLASLAKSFVERSDFVLASGFVGAALIAQHRSRQHTGLGLIRYACRATPTAQTVARLAFGDPGQADANAGHRDHQIGALLRGNVVGNPAYTALCGITAVGSGNGGKCGVKHRTWAAKRHHDVRPSGRPRRNNRDRKLRKVGARAGCDVGDQRGSVDIVGPEFGDVDVVEPVNAIGDCVASGSEGQADAFEVQENDTAIAAHARVNRCIRCTRVIDSAVGSVTRCVDPKVRPLGLGNATTGQRRGKDTKEGLSNAHGLSVTPLWAAVGEIATLQSISAVGDADAIMPQYSGAGLCQCSVAWQRPKMATSTLWDSVGNTPLLRIASLSKLTGCEIFGKAEFMNPGASIKDRAAKSMIAGAEARGELRPGGTIVEGTAGNTGIGLAMLGRERGYNVVVTIPDNQAREKYELLGAMGADVRQVPVVPFANPNHFFHQARELSVQHGWYWANQFENLDNSGAHYTTTGPEIFAQAGHVDVLVSAVGTGGTIAGVSRFLREKFPALHVLAVDPDGSGIYSYVKTGEFKCSGSSITEGIGIMRATANFATGRVDDVMHLSDQPMLEMLYHLAAHDGLVVGTSAALNVRGAYEYAMAHRGSGKRIVTMLCDHGSRYTSKVFNREFLATRNLVPRGLQA